MRISINTRQAYSEVDEFLNLISNKHRNKVPNELRRLFKEEKDTSYKKGIDVNLPIREQELKEETLAIIALLNLNYWCDDENEKERLKKVYANNEKTYQDNLQIAFNSDEIFKKKEYNEYAQELIPIVQYKESIIKKIINKFKKYFK